MHRRRAATVAAIATLGPLVAPGTAPAHATTARGPAATTTVSASVPAPVLEDGFAVRRVAAVLAPLDALPPEVEAQHRAHAAEAAGGHAPDEARVAGAGTPVGAVVPLAGSPGQVILELDAAGEVELAVRSRNDGRWSGWALLGSAADDTPDGLPGGEGSVPAPPAVGPVWIGSGAEAVEVVVVEGDVDGIDVLGLTSAVEPTAVTLGVPASDAGAPPIIGRETWGPAPWAVQTAGCENGPRTASRLNAAVVHHTVSVNDYTPEQVPEMIRGIQWFHVNSRGWCDIAYNVVVDRFGRIWEARAGGLDRAIIGGHATGFNTGTFGVVALGQFHPGASPASAAPSLELLESLARVIQWKFAVHGTRASGPVALTSGADGNLFLTGEVATVDVVATHRDLARTACAGDLLVAQLPLVRARVGALAFAHHLFRTFVGRSPTDAERVQWAGEVGRLGRDGAALALAQSEAWAGAMVDGLYQAVLGRPADAPGRTYWLGRLLGGMRYEDVAVQFYGSPEYYAAAGSPPAFVHRLYDALLHRPADAPGLAYWSAELGSGRATPARVVGGFYASLESRLDRVDALYRSVLGRDSDEPGRRYWADQLLRTDDVRLAAFLASSDEFYARSQS